MSQASCDGRGPSNPSTDWANPPKTQKHALQSQESHLRKEWASPLAVGPPTTERSGPNRSDWTPLLFLRRAGLIRTWGAMLSNHMLSMVSPWGPLYSRLFAQHLRAQPTVSTSSSDTSTHLRFGTCSVTKACEDSFVSQSYRLGLGCHSASATHGERVERITRSTHEKVNWGVSCRIVRRVDDQHP